MADTKLSALSGAPSVGKNDLTYLVPAALGAEYKATVDQLLLAPGTPSNGQLLIGNGTDYTVASLTARGPGLP